MRARLDLAVSDLGETKLKNIGEPMRVYSLEVGIAAKPRPETQVEPVAPAEFRATLALPDKPSIAMLPFDDMSRDGAHDFLADGIVESITAALSHVVAQLSDSA